MLVNNVLTGAPQFETSIYYIALSMIPATALATMDAFQAERRQNTERLIYSLPLKNTDIVLGKLAALMVPLMIAMACLCLFPAAMTMLGPTPLGSAYASILALALLGAAMMAVGLFISACACSRAVAFLGTVAALALSWAAPYAGAYLETVGTVTVLMMLAFMLLAFTLTYLLSSSGLLGIVMAALVEIPMLLSYLQNTGAQLMQSVADGVAALSLFEGLNSFINGLLDGRMLVTWAAVVCLFAFFTILYVGNRRQAKRRAL